MRPVRLIMQAFGPYAEKEVIDFTKLGNRTMFVISGRTGAGKTTIFDGISYAIYGKASGEDRSGPDLRSQFADDDIPTEVSLQFILRGKQYFIKRSPQQEKKKERGDGYTTISAKAELYVFNEEGKMELLSANVREVDEKIKQIMQIDANQFRQIIMIPQGEFRKLLVSDSKEKEVILQRIFQTYFYKRVEEKLKEEAALLKSEVERYSLSKWEKIKMFEPVENEELSRLLKEQELNERAIIPLFEEQMITIKERIVEWEKQIQKKEEERNTIHSKWVQAKQILEQINRKEQLAARKKELDQQKDAIQEKQTLLSQAEKAERLRQQEEICQRLKKDLDEQTKKLNEYERQFEQMEKLVREREIELKNEKNNEPLREQAALHLQKLQSIRDDVHSFAEWKRKSEQIKKNLKENQVSIQNYQKLVEENESRLQQLEKQRLEIQQLTYHQNDAKYKIDKLNLLLDDAKIIRDSWKRMADLTLLKDKQEKEMLVVEEQYQLVKEEYRNLERTWQQAQSSLLAQQLEDGKPCPVCGSTHHPQKASHHDQLISEEQLKQMRHKLEQYENEKTKKLAVQLKTASDLKSLQENIESLMAKIKKHAPNVNVEQFEEWYEQKLLEKKEWTNRLKEYELRLKELQTTEENIGLVEKELKKTKEKLEQLNQQNHEWEKDLTEKVTMLTRLESIIPPHLREVQSYEKEVEQAKKVYETLVQKLELAQKQYTEANDAFLKIKGQIASLKTVTDELTEKLEFERKKFLEQMKNLGFMQYKDYQQAKMTEEMKNKISEEIQNYREEYRSVSDQLNELDKWLTNVDKPDLHVLEQNLLEINKQLTNLRTEYHRLQAKRDKNEFVLSEVKQLNEKLHQLEEQYKIVGHLADITRGQNVQKITFERYVLASFLDDILLVANKRLLKMTNGRYHLVRKKDRAKGNVQSGLELLVFDQYTGLERHVKTLSGGESFKASLSLALGLADVVQEYAGGVSLETMFIDEGFGTLDPESLDQAIEALFDIQSSGRLVGIISHVPELKERIDARIEVIATQNGSRTQFVLSP